MMKFHRALNVPLTFFFALYFLLGSLFGDLVICIEERGEIHLESAATACCNPCEGLSHGRHTQSEKLVSVDPTQDNCQACIDIHICLSSTNLIKPSFQHPNWAPVLAPAPFIASFAPFFDPSIVIAGDGIVPFSPTDSIRTMVLLC